MDLTRRAGYACCHVQDCVAEAVDLAAGYGRCVGEADQLGPAHEVGRGQHDFEPRPVLGHPPAGEVCEPGCLALADAVLDPRVAAVAQLQALDGKLSRAGVGDEGRVTPTVVELEEAELGTWVGAFPPQDDPRALRPGRKVPTGWSPRPRKHLPSPRRLVLSLRTTPLLAPWRAPSAPFRLWRSRS